MSYLYPTSNYENPDRLMKSLGSFWNQVFQEKETLRGLVRGHSLTAEQKKEYIENFLKSYSVQNAPVYEKRKNYPILIERANFNLVPFVFEPDAAVFGIQPESDPFFGGMTFQFGEAKKPKESIFAVSVTEELANVSIISNRLLTPNKVYIYGVDFIKQKNTLYFNTDIFADTNEDKLLLFGVGASIDIKTLAENFQFIFDSQLVQSTQQFKDVLIAIFALYTQGATIANILKLLSSLLGIPISKTEETVEETFTTETAKVLVTDKNVYKFPLTGSFVKSVGETVPQHTCLTDHIALYDNVTHPFWWRREHGFKLGFSSKIFVGNYNYHLFFKNEFEIVQSDANNDFHFPVEGSAEDVATFQASIDKVKVAELLNLSANGTVVFNPLDFVMEHFFKNNTAFINLKNIEDYQLFFDNFYWIKNLFPDYVYFIIDLSVALSVDTYANLNDCFDMAFVDNLDQEYFLRVNADGSDETGEVEKLAPYNYTDVIQRLFSLGKGPVIDYEFVECNGDNEVDKMTVTDGNVLNPIPVNATFYTYSNLKLLDF